MASNILDVIKHYQLGIEKNPNDQQRVLRCIEKLNQLGVTVQHLQETGVGRTVNALRKEPGGVGTAAKTLVNKWKIMVASEEMSEPEDDNHDTSKYHGNEYDDPDHYSTKRDINGDHSSHKRKYHSSEDEEYSKKKSRYSPSSEDIENNKVKSEHSSSESDKHNSDDNDNDDADSQGDRSEMANESDNDTEIKPVIKREKEKNSSKYSSDEYKKTDKHKKTNSGSSSKHEHAGDKYSKHHISSEKSSNEKHFSSKHKSYSKDRTSEKDRNKVDHQTFERATIVSPDRHSHNLDKQKSSSLKDKNHKSDKHSRKTESQSDKSNKEKQMASDRRDKSSKHRSRSRESSSKEKNRHTSEKEKEKNEKNRERSKDKASFSKEKMSHSDKNRDRHLSSENRSKSSSDNKSKSDKAVDSSSEKHSKHKSSSSSSHKSSKSNKEQAPKKKKSQNINDDNEDGIDCGSGASFAEALGMTSPVKIKKKTQGKESTTPIKESPDYYKNSDQMATTTSPVTTPAALLAPPTTQAPLRLVEISALPEISPNYKPRPPPKLLPHFSEEDTMGAAISSKNQRTKVFSGNKTYGKLPTLYELCVQVLQDNIDALEYTGGVPYDILKPVVDKATPNQLFTLEHYNPYLMEDTDHLWQKFCAKHFRKEKRQELETWREMYMRCQEEQEHKLKSLTANIKMAQDAKNAPVKQTKMAYVDSIVKPPRSIARKQALHGTARPVAASPAARVAALSGALSVLGAGTVRPPLAGPTHSSSAAKPKKAPLMQKALQFMRGRKR